MRNILLLVMCNMVNCNYFKIPGALGAKYISKWINFDEMNHITYYWIMFTILTGIWEASYILYHNETINMAISLLNTGEHIWCKKYLPSMILP